MVKVIVADIDNTLVSHRKEMSDVTKKAIIKLNDAGIIFGIASGRPFCQVKPLIDNWDIKVDFVISANGCELYDLNDNTIQTYFMMKPEWFKEIIEYMKPFHGNPMMVIDGRQTALYEDEDGYYTCKIAFNILKENNGFKIKSLLVTDKEPMYDFEVFDEISKSEYIDVYKLKNKEQFLMEFYNDNPFMLKSEMEEGMFFTRFNFNNNHVKENIYVINNDIKSIYYQVADEFFVGTYSEKDRKYINKLLMAKYKEYLSIDESYFFEENVLYDFVESGSNDFEDFLD